MKFLVLTLRKQKRNTKIFALQYGRFLKKNDVRSGSGQRILCNFPSLLRHITANTIKYIAAKPALQFLAAILKPFRAQRMLTDSSSENYRLILFENVSFGSVGKTSKTFENFQIKSEIYDFF